MSRFPPISPRATAMADEDGVQRFTYAERGWLRERVLEARPDGLSFLDVGGRRADLAGTQVSFIGHRHCSVDIVAAGRHYKLGHRTHDAARAMAQALRELHPGPL